MVTNVEERYLGIDYGEVRLGLAMANSIAKLPSTYSILPNDQQTIEKLQKIIVDEKIDKIVVGLPRDMSGRETKQSESTREFAANLMSQVDKPLVFADESLSSVRAADVLSHRKLSGKHQDDIAACYILEEFLENLNRKT